MPSNRTRDKVVSDQKRGGSSSPGISSRTGRPVKKRSPAACQGCRARKVRCNVLEYGAPCTNCRLDGISCIVSVGKSRVFADSNVEPYLGGFVAGRQQLPPEHDITQFVNGAVNDDLNEGQVHTGSHTRKWSLNFDYKSNTLHQNSDVAERDTSQFTDRRSSMPDLTTNISQSFELGIPSALSPPLRFVQRQLPAWVKPPSANLDPDDVEYLWKAGALTVPDTALRNEFLTCFIEWVYPWTPMVNLKDVLRTMSKDDGNAGQLSLLVVQAIMFAGAGFAKLSLLQQAGFETRKDAKKHLFRRVKLLYNFSYETDRISVIQALILMTYWVESSDDQKDIWHWIGIAISMATKMGLHQTPDQLVMELSEKHLRKRIWWSLFMRDRLVSLAMRRYTQIEQENSNVPLLELDDFDMEVLPEDIISSTQSTFPRDIHKQMQIAQLCIEEVKLCIIIGHLLRVQYSTVWIDQGTSLESQSNTKTTMALMPNDISTNASEIGIIERELSSWVSALPESIAYQRADERNLNGYPDSFLVHRATISMLYHTAMNVHNRPLSRIDANLFSIPPTLFAIGTAAFQKTRIAASTITQIATELLSLDLIRYLQPVGVTVVVSAAMVHLGEATAPNEEIRQCGISRLSQSMVILEQLRDIYIAGDLACYLLSSGIKKAGIQLSTWSRSDSVSVTGSDPTDHPFNQHREVQIGNKSKQARENSYDSFRDRFGSTSRLQSERSSEDIAISPQMSTQFHSDYSGKDTEDASVRIGTSSIGDVPMFNKPRPSPGLAYEVGALTEDRTLFEYANELERGMEWMSQVTKF